MTENPKDKLKFYRDRIDAIDEKIVALMNQRITAAQSIGKLKSSLDEPAFYRPEREANVLKRLHKLNTGPLEADALEVLFREVMSIARSSESPLSVAMLGPTGTYTESAARRHFGSSITLVPYSTIDEIFAAAENSKTNFAVVPVENSMEGGVSDTLDRLATTSLLICGEIQLQIHHNLLGAGKKLSSVKRVIAHAQSLAQCKGWLARHLPAAKLVAAPSNADAARRVKNTPASAAIAGKSAAKQYGLNFLATDIEDQPGNSTRFLVLSSRAVPPSGDDKTSLLLSCRNRPGALFYLLKPLLEHQIDMTKIESHPSKTGRWEYLFFIDIIGHQKDEKVANALKELSAEAGLYKDLGSYPASRSRSD